MAAKPARRVRALALRRGQQQQQQQHQSDGHRCGVGNDARLMKLGKLVLNFEVFFFLSAGSFLACVMCRVPLPVTTTAGAFIKNSP